MSPRVVLIRTTGSLVWAITFETNKIIELHNELRYKISAYSNGVKSIAKSLMYPGVESRPMDVPASIPSFDTNTSMKQEKQNKIGFV